MADTTKIYENIFIKKNAAGDREYIKVPYAILADPPTIPDVSGFMPKSGGTFTGNISVPKTITFTDTTNPYIKMTTGGTDFYFQSTSGQFGLGPTWNKATHWDANGNVTFPTTPKVGSSSLALKSEIPTNYVPNTRKVNNKALSSDITLDASDVRALPIAGGTVTGNLTVGGNLTVNGTTTTVDSTTLQVKDKLIEVAHGNTAALTTPAGLVAPKYDGTNSGALVFDSTGTAYVGDVTLKDGNIDVANSDLQTLATRTGLVNDNLVKYDSANQTLVDSGKKTSDFATAAQGSNADSALAKANANATEISNIKNGTNGTKVKYAEHADAADSATSAGTADKVANGLTIANATFDGSKPLTIGTSGKHIEIMGGSAASPNNVTIGLKYGNLMPSSYNKVTIDGYGIVTDGENIDYLTSHQSIKSLKTDNTESQAVNPNEAIAGSGTINLHKVAKTGSYNDLLYKPTIPAAAKNGTLTIQQNGTNVATFGANQSTNATANITTITDVKMNSTSKVTNGVADLGTVLTDASKFATSAQGTKADNAMPKSGGTFTGDVIIASGHHLKTDLIKSADDSKWIAEITGAGLEIGGSGTPLRFYSNTRPVVANQNKELAYTSDIPDISGKANLADGNTFGSQQTFEDITGTTTINGSYVAIQPTGAQGAYSFEVLNSNNTTAFSVIGDSSGSIKVGSPVSLGNNFGTSGQVLTSQGAGETPTWTTPAIKSVSLSGTTLTITL